MNELETALLAELTGGAGHRLVLRSRTRIDAGRWWRRTPVWLCITASELILLAVARRRYSERVPLGECHASNYAHATGELVVGPAGSLRIKRILLTPREALNALDLLSGPSNTQLKP